MTAPGGQRRFCVPVLVPPELSVVIVATPGHPPSQDSGTRGQGPVSVL